MESVTSGTKAIQVRLDAKTGIMKEPRRLRDDHGFIAETGCDLADESLLDTHPRLRAPELDRSLKLRWGWLVLPFLIASGAAMAGFWPSSAPETPPDQGVSRLDVLVPSVDDPVEPTITPIRPVQQVKAPVSSTLRRESAMMARGLSAMEQGDYGQATSIFVDYQNQFPRGHLVMEAQLNEIRCLALAKRWAPVVEKSTNFLDNYSGASSELGEVKALRDLAMARLFPGDNPSED